MCIFAFSNFSTTPEERVHEISVEQTLRRKELYTIYSSIQMGRGQDHVTKFVNSQRTKLNFFTTSEARECHQGWLGRLGGVVVRASDL